MREKSSNRSFGIIFFIVFLLISVWPIMDGQEPRVWSLIISLIFLILGILNSKILTPFNLAWIKLGEILGRFIAPVVMAVIYFLIVTPIGLFMRIIGKDLLNLKFSQNSSYWIKREKNLGPMKRQF
ncbi:MAG: hypothetical protein CBC84_002650 [Pelagibacteraceae bacterium TMED124]|nr:MAG: hypothetical protein CBC84_002650 [Pelagibacteraceae bacterium TMED124]